MGEGIRLTSTVNAAAVKALDAGKSYTESLERALVTEKRLGDALGTLGVKIGTPINASAKDVIARASATSKKFKAKESSRTPEATKFLTLSSPSRSECWARMKTENRKPRQTEIYQILRQGGKRQSPASVKPAAEAPTERPSLRTRPRLPCTLRQVVPVESLADCRLYDGLPGLR